MPVFELTETNGTYTFAPQAEGVPVFAVGFQSNATDTAADDGGEQWPEGCLQVRRYGGMDMQIAPAVSPLDHWSNSEPNGVGFMLQFAIDHGGPLIVVPGAQVGKGFASTPSFTPGDTLYTDLAARINVALAHPGAYFAGVFAIGGNADAQATDDANAWPAEIDAFMASLRSEFNAPELPLYLGQLAAFSGTNPAKVAIRHHINDTPNRLANSHLVMTEDLPTSDGKHYTAASRRVIGSRFFAAFSGQPQQSTPQQSEISPQIIAVGNGSVTLGE